MLVGQVLYYLSHSTSPCNQDLDEILTTPYSQQARCKNPLKICQCMNEYEKRGLCPYNTILFSLKKGNLPPLTTQKNLY
jgi:hypothetical protein